jgi:diguanylate cyclase (GGDEF)-like protein/PAS domain S-box-containing protein
LEYLNKFQLLNKARLWSSWLSFCAVIPIVAVAALFRAVFLGGLGRGIPYLTFYPAVMVAALYGGMYSGLAATGLSAFLCLYWIQKGSLSFPESLALAVFVMSCIMISGISGAMRRAQERAKQLAAIVESSDDAIIGKTLDGYFTSWNSGAERLYGYTKEEIIGRSIEILIPPEISDETPALLAQLVQGKRVDHYETMRRKKDGALINVSLIISPIKDHTGAITGASVIARDITAQKKAEELLRKLSTTDGLTGIANRHALDRFMDEEWRRTLRNNGQLSFMMIDVDYFKKFNDTYGHVQGDECLKSVAGILKKFTQRPGDVAVRFGGEEFLIASSMIDANGAIFIAERIRREVEALKIAHERSDVSDYVTVSIGVVSVYPEQGMSPADIIKGADKALYEAKESGRNRVVVKKLATFDQAVDKQLIVADTF